MGKAIDGIKWNPPQTRLGWAGVEVLRGPGVLSSRHAFHMCNSLGAWKGTAGPEVGA